MHPWRSPPTDKSTANPSTHAVYCRLGHHSSLLSDDTLTQQVCKSFLPPTFPKSAELAPSIAERRCSKDPPPTAAAKLQAPLPLPPASFALSSPRCSLLPARTYCHLPFHLRHPSLGVFRAEIEGQRCCVTLRTEGLEGVFEWDRRLGKR